MFPKSCPKCSGDIFLENDVYGKYIRCMQCGYHKDTISPIIEEPVRRTRRNLNDFTQEERSDVFFSQDMIFSKTCYAGHKWKESTTWYSVDYNNKIVRNCLVCRALREVKNESRS